jgi:dedicator of cytokinesis protein 3
MLNQKDFSTQAWVKLRSSFSCLCVPLARNIYWTISKARSAEGVDSFASMMSKVFELATSILSNDAFPTKWLNVNNFAHKVILQLMESISVILRQEFIPHPQAACRFNATLWRETFYMLLTLLSSDQLIIEEFSAQVSTD